MQEKLERVLARLHPLTMALQTISRVPLAQKPMQHPRPNEEDTNFLPCQTQLRAFFLRSAAASPVNFRRLSLSLQRQ